VKALADATGVSFDYLMGYEAPPAGRRKDSSAPPQNDRGREAQQKSTPGGA